MSLNNLKLSPSNIVNLYNNQLVTGTKLGTSKEAQPSLDTKGDNEAKVTIIVNDKLNKYIGDNDLELLLKIITACGLTMSSVALLNLAAQKADIQTIKKQLQPKTIIMFGVNSDEINLPLIFTEYKIQEYDGVNYVRSHSFASLAATPVYRKSLWECIRVIFNK